MAQMTSNIKDFQTLIVWQKARKLTIDIYKITNDFPAHEQYGITSQIRRSSTSVGANIAEGNGQLFLNKQIQFLNISLGSIAETRHWLITAKDLQYITAETYSHLDDQCVEITKMLFGFVKNLR